MNYNRHSFTYNSSLELYSPWAIWKCSKCKTIVFRLDKNSPDLDSTFDSYDINKYYTSNGEEYVLSCEEEIVRDIIT